MSHENPVNVVFLWHMHQPQYQDIINETFYLPWTYLHAIKDYSDMAYALEQCASAKAVVNFTPVLLDQLQEYGDQLDRHLADQSPIGDPILAALSRPQLSDDAELRRNIILQCTRANEKNIVGRFPEYKHLVSIARDIINKPGTPLYLNEQYYYDLLVWYHLAWMGESVRMKNSVLNKLLEKGHNYSFSDRMELIEVICTEIKKIVPRYRKLSLENKVEISFTPDAHPILPLLIDFHSAVESKSGTSIPQGKYPSGLDRARTHIRTGLEKFEKAFGFRPNGCWPAEGGVCEKTIHVLAEEGLIWTASGGGVLRNSLEKGGQEKQCIHHSFSLQDIDLTCFYRDDNLSDLIGFTYYGWNEDDAVNNLIHHTQNIREACQNASDTIIPIILDGENCWEHYRHNGYYFLQKLYKKMSEHPLINLTTFSDHINQHPEQTQLNCLVPGSWVYADFSTWIGSEDKNRGWELLCKAKAAYDEAVSNQKIDEKNIHLAERQLAICESSDWFWWFGDYNAAESVSDFDYLYRLHLKNLYKLIGQPAPTILDQVISIGHGSPDNDGVMRRSEQH